MAEAVLLAKKIITSMILPLGLSLGLVVLGLVLLYGSRERRWGRRLILAGWLVLGVCSLPVVGIALVAPLERQAGEYAKPVELARQGVEVVVVLGGGMVRRMAPSADQLTSASLVRVHEGVRLWRGLKGASLIVSDGGTYRGVSCASLMARVARDLGVPQEAVILEDKSLDTEDQAKRLAEMLRGKVFVLVTSAFHVARSRELFVRQGLKPIMAPTDFKALGVSLGVQSFVPSSRGLLLTDRAIKEYLGRLWYWVKSLVGG